MIQSFDEIANEHINMPILIMTHSGKWADLSARVFLVLIDGSIVVVYDDGNGRNTTATCKRENVKLKF